MRQTNFGNCGILEFVLDRFDVKYFLRLSQHDWDEQAECLGIKVGRAVASCRGQRIVADIGEAAGRLLIKFGGCFETVLLVQLNTACYFWTTRSYVE